MRKKICMFLLVFLLGFVVNLNVCKAAAVTCRYVGDNVTITFGVSSDGKIVRKPSVEGTHSIEKGGTKKWTSENVLNWDDNREGFSGKEYFKKNLECPKYAGIYYLAWESNKGGSHYSNELYVSSDKAYLNKENIEKIAKDINRGLTVVGTILGGVKISVNTEVYAIATLVEGDTAGTSSNANIAQGKPNTRCITYKDKDSCERNSGASDNRTHACLWNEEYGFCNVDKLTYLQCGSAKDVPEIVPSVTSFIVTFLKILAPLILIIVSLITLVKSIAAGKEDEIKKAQTSLIKKIIASVLVFLVISIVQFVILRVSDDDEHDSLTNCLKCLLNNDCDSVTYFKDGYGNCYNVDDKENPYICDL